MTDEEIVQAVNDWKQENNIHSIYIPTVEAYYIRARQRYQWTDDVLKQKLSELKGLKKIVVAKLKSNSVGARLVVNKDGTCQIQVNEYTIKNIIDEEDGFETFFNDMLHELTHFEKLRKNSMKCNTRIPSLSRMSEDGTLSANMTEELATVINTELLQNGTIETSKFLIGYTNMQYYFNIVLAAMGVSRKEFADLQELGRDGYEEYFIKKIGRDSLIIIYSLEDMLDTIQSLKELEARKPNNVQIKSNIALQGRNLIKQTYNLLIKRVQFMKQRPKQEVSRDVIRKVLEDGKIVHGNSKHIVATPESDEEKSFLNIFFDEVISLYQAVGIKDEDIKRLSIKKSHNQKLYDWENGIVDYNTRVEMRDNGIPRTEVYESRIDKVKDIMNKLWQRIRGERPLLLVPGLQEDDICSMQNQHNNFVHNLEYKLEDRKKYDKTGEERTNDRVDGRDRSE